MIKRLCAMSRYPVQSPHSYQGLVKTLRTNVGINLCKTGPTQSRCFSHTHWKQVYKNQTCSELPLEATSAQEPCIRSFVKWVPMAEQIHQSLRWLCGMPSVDWKGVKHITTGLCSRETAQKSVWQISGGPTHTLSEINVLNFHWGSSLLVTGVGPSRVHLSTFSQGT